MRCRLSIAALMTVVTSLAAQTPAGASPLAEAGLTAGYVWPQGEFTNFADPGPTFHLRFTYHMPWFSSLIGWGDLGYTNFQTNRSTVHIDVPGYSGTSTRVTEEQAFTLHVGPQIGSPTSKAFFRPRAGVGIGLNVFSRDDNYEYYDSFDEVASYSGDNGLLVGRFGWRGALATDLFFSPKWGISVDFHYDHIWDAHRRAPATYHSITLGAVLPIDKW